MSKAWWWSAVLASILNSLTIFVSPLPTMNIFIAIALIWLIFTINPE